MPGSREVLFILRGRKRDKRSPGERREPSQHPQLSDVAIRVIQVARAEQRSRKIVLRTPADEEAVLQRGSLRTKSNRTRLLGLVEASQVVLPVHLSLDTLQYSSRHSVNIC